MSSNVGSLENYYVSLSKAVADGAKSNNQLLKFNILCNVDQQLERLNKTELDSNASKWISLLSNCLLQTIGTSMSTIIGDILSRLFDLPQGSKVSTTIVKSIITSLSTKQTNPQTKSALADVLGIIFKNSKTLAIVYMSESFQLFSRLIKASEAKISCMRAITLMLESVGPSGTPIHLECFKLIKAFYSATTSTPEFKLECLSAVVPIAKYYNNSDIKLDGLDQKILNFIIKSLTEESNANINNNTAAGESPCVKRASESLGFTLAALYHKDCGGGAGSSGTPNSSIIKPSIISSGKSTWTLDYCQNFIGQQFISTNKKEMKINLTIGYTTFLQNINLAYLEKDIDSILSHLLKLLGSTNRNLSTQQDQAQTRSSISFILRHGLGQRLSENGQQLMVRYFTNIISQADTFNELTIVVSLKELCQLLNELGEGGISQYDDLSTYLFSLLNDRNQSTRQWSAIGLRSLASNIPKLTFKLLSQCLLNLNSILEEFEKPNIQPEPLKKIMNSVKGNALGIASLLTTLRSSELGVPTTLIQQITKSSLGLLANPDFLNPAITLAKLEAGWSIMNSLLKYMGESFVSEILPPLFACWKQCFNITTVHPTAERDIVIFAKTRADALLPLHSLIVNNPKLMNSKMIASIVTFLSNTLKTVSELPAMSTSFQASTNEITQMLELNLIRAFQALPASGFATQHTMLMTVVTSLILDGNHNSLLPTLFSKDDADTLLPDFNSIHSQLESQFLIPMSSQDSSLVTLPNITDCYNPNFTQSLEVRVVNASIELFATLFISQPDRHRTQLLDHFSNCIKECNNPNQKHVMTINSMATLLYILKSMSTSNMAFGKSDVASNMQRFVQRYFGDANLLLRRASAESLGVLCRLEGDNVTTAIIKSLTELIRKPSREVPSMVRAGSALVFGCVQRSVGGMMSQKHLPTTIANLHVLAQDQNAPEVSSHALHALYVTIQSSGFSFNSFASPTLMLLQTILLGENPPYQLLGRVVNSIVIALGPELETNRDVLSKCTATCAIIKRHDSPVIRVESIYYLQKLIMFASGTVNESIIPVLISQFKSPFLMLRISAVTCLRQLINKKSFEVGMNVVEDLFMMIDTESDKELQKEIKLLINTIIDNVAPNNPSTWLMLCMNIILSSKQMTKDSTLDTSGNQISTAGGKAQASPTPGGRGGMMSGDDEEKDDDEDVKVVVQQQANDKVEYVYRWFTKVYAIECVRRVISVVKNKPEHFNMLLAMANQSGRAGEHLILHLHDLVGIAFKAATSQIDTMRPVGILLLKDILESFSSSIDPDYEGHLLLELYQAQIMSALRPAFSSDSLPNLLSVGCSVFVNFVEGSLHYDSSALKKTTTQLATPVKDLRNLNFPVYNEKATTLVQLSILKTFAQLYLLCRKKESLNNILSQVITPILPYLRVHWVTFLKEYSLLVSQPPSIYHVCNPMFFSPLSYNESVDYFKEAYPFVIKALAYLIGTPFWSEGRSLESAVENTNNEEKDKSTTSTTAKDPILSETKSIEDINLVLGLAVLPQEKFLADPVEKNLNSNHMSLTLETVALILQPNTMNLEEFSIDRINEISQILHRACAFANNKIQSLIIENINNLFQCFGDTIIKDSEILNLLLKVLFDPIKPENEDYQIKFYQCCTFIIKFMNNTQIEDYTPLFLLTVTQTLTTANTNLITAAVQFTINLLKLFISNCQSGDFTVFSSILNSSITSTIHLLNTHFAESYQGLLLLLSTLIVNQQQNINDDITRSVIDFFRTSILNKNKSAKERLYSLQVLRNIITSGTTHSKDNPIHTFASKLLNALLLDLQSSLVIPPATSPSTTTNDNDLVTLEIFKLFTLSLSLLKNEDQKCKLLQMIVQTMIFFLNPQQQQQQPSTTSIHSNTLQILLNYASTQPLFKEAVATLPQDQKQTLEQSIRQSFEQPAKKEIKLPTKPSIQLNFDFSKQIGSN